MLGAGAGCWVTESGEMPPPWKECYSELCFTEVQLRVKLGRTGGEAHQGDEDSA